MGRKSGPSSLVAFQNKKKKSRATSNNLAAGTVSCSSLFNFSNNFEKFSSPLELDDYDVSRFYFDGGIAQATARSGIFGNLTLIVIMMNFIYLGFELEQNKAKTVLETDVFFLVSDSCF